MNIISTSEVIEIIDIDKIIYLEYHKGGTIIHLEKEIQSKSSIPFSHFDSDFNKLFFKINRLYIVNLTKIKRYHRDGHIELLSGHLLPISRRRRNPFLSRLTYVAQNTFR